ncbi:hypothetical protein H7J87_19470 [Mycolicibacterium wolinskyi]|uniref:Uncharacterized protein n=1 Tax=Mycolicibacterium wolinskyi TaxID=59750 RepID=A0A1X2F9A1_9MYCO|nr:MULTISPECIES: hypothetical protein [Mycolicibacterium]MCV7287506.1 hypothetical protein [Mycolicibacterium wolinskyi]MCV7294404.1 hypothetical protein [Mycolicibacterium goodii]ORX14974.1 hypothetical protein AWC31_27960 [Mycolicibacterium wolinskyi]
MADKGFRRSLTAGVALAGAGVISLGSIAALPDTDVEIAAVAPRVVSTEVQHVNFAEYAQILAAGATEALELSGDALFRKVPELWQTVQATWPDADLTHWNYALVADMVFAPIAPLVIGPFNDAVAHVLARQFPALETEIRQLPELVEYTAVRLVGPLLSAIGGAGMAHSEIFYSMTTGELQPFFEAVVRAPFHVVDGLLNGGYGDLGPLLPGREGDYIPAPGILTPWGEEPAPRDIKTPEDVETAEASTAVEEVEDVVEADETEDATVSPLRAVVEKLTKPAVEEVTVSTETKTETEVQENGSATDTADTTDTTDTKTESEVAKPSRKGVQKSDDRSGIRQSVKDFRSNVRDSVKKLTGNTKSTTRTDDDKKSPSSSAAGSSDSGDNSGSDSSE